MGFVHRKYLLYGLDFQYQRLLGDDVYLQIAIDGVTFVDNRQFLLANMGDAGAGQFVTDAGLRDGFQ